MIEPNTSNAISNKPTQRGGHICARANPTILSELSFLKQPGNIIQPNAWHLLSPSGGHALETTFYMTEE